MIAKISNCSDIIRTVWIYLRVYFQLRITTAISKTILGLETKAKQGEYAGSLYFFEGDSLVELRRELPNGIN